MRNLNPRETYLLRFLRGAEVIDLPLAHALLAPQAEQRGVAKHFGAAKDPRNSNVRRILYRLCQDKILRKHEYGSAYLIGRGAEKHFPEDKRIRSLSRRSLRQGLGKVMHDLITTHFLTVLDLAKQRGDRWDYKVLKDGAEPLLKMDGRNVKLDKLVELTDRQEGLRYWYFVESDRATAALRSDIPKKRNIKSKVEWFYRYSTEIGFKKHFGFPGARLLFLVPEEKKGRAEAIRGVVKESRVIHRQSNLFRYSAIFPWHLTEPEAFVVWLTQE